MDIFLEGIRASIEPCSLALVLPALGASILGGRRAWAVAFGFWIAAAGLAWAQASILLDVGQSRVTGFVLGVFALAGLVLLWLARPSRRDRPSQRDRPTTQGARASFGFALGGGVLMGTAAGLLWQPCVGPELGAILTAAPRGPSAQLLPLMVYLAGVLLLTALISALPFLHDRAPAVLEAIPTALIAVIPVAGLAVVLVTGRYEEIIGALVRASSL